MMNKEIFLVEPWIFSGTIRQNILFGLDYDAQKFNRCIHATALNIVCSFFFSLILFDDHIHIDLGFRKFTIWRFNDSWR